MKTSDYHTFFDNHYSEIEELRLYIENDNNIKLNLQYNFDLKTQLSIFAISNIICKEHDEKHEKINLGMLRKRLGFYLQMG